MTSAPAVYDEDIILWSEHQADLLRRLAAGEPTNETPDWSNIVEEIESVGNEQRHAVESLLLQAMLHMIKAEAWPDCRDVDHWLDEARLFRAQATARFVPSMRQRIDMTRLWRLALRAMPRRVDGQPPRTVPEACPMTLDQLLSEEP